MHRSRSPSPTSSSPRPSRHIAGTTQTHPPPVVHTAQGPQPEAAPGDGTPAPIDQPLPNADPDARALVSVAHSPGAVLQAPTPMQLPALESQEGIDASVLQRLLATWPSSQSDTNSITPSQQAVAMAAVQNPSLFENLPPELNTLLLSMVLGDPEHMHKAEQAAQLRRSYHHVLRVSKSVHQLVTREFRDRVLLCTLRLPPTSEAQLLAMPVHEMFFLTERTLVPTTVLEQLIQALSRLPTDEQACRMALILGRQSLQATLSPGIPPATQRALLCVPQFIVRALRVRLHGREGHAHSIVCTLKGLLHWAVEGGPALGLPLLLELAFTVGQIEHTQHEDLLESPDVSLSTHQVEDAIGTVCAQPNALWPLIHSVYWLVGLMPDPWSAEPPAPPAAHAVTTALKHLADYPCAFVGFVREVLAYLRRLPLDEEQQALMQRCLQRLEAPLQVPQPTPEQ